MFLQVETFACEIAEIVIECDMRNRERIGVSPDAVGPAPGRDMVSCYHTIQTTSAIHIMIIIDERDFYNLIVFFIRVFWILFYHLSYNTGCLVWTHTDTPFLISHKVSGRTDEVCLPGMPL